MHSKLLCVALLPWVATASISASIVGMAPECSLNGEKDPSTYLCQCDAPWSGLDCGRLQVLPVSFPQGYGMMPNQTTWGAEIYPLVQPNGSIQYHLLATSMTGGCSLRSWTTHSRIDHAVSDSITGPYKFQDIALPTFSHNPKLIELPQGGFALFHIGEASGPNEGGKCQQLAASSRLLNQADDPENANIQHAIHIATSIHGPWTPLENNTLNHCNNPAPFLHDSTTNPNIPSAFYIACNVAFNNTVLFQSPNLWGPWQSVSQVIPFPQDGSRIDGSPKTIVYEDPNLYIDHRGFHILFHRYNRDEYPPHGHDCRRSTISAHIFSPDGQTWYKSMDQPFNNHIPLTSGETILVATRERPSVVIGKNPTTGHPRLTHLISGTCSAVNCPNGPPPGCVDCKYDSWDYTLIQPLKV